MASRVNELLIRTPEGVEFSLSLAGPLSRFLAWSIDMGVLLVLLSVMSKIVQGLGLFSRGYAVALGILAAFLIRIGYAMALEWCWRGQTVGKRLLRLRVIDETGLRLHFSQIVLRNLLRFVDELPALGLVGGIACFWSKRSQRIGDYAANTVVIREPQIGEPDLESLFADKYNTFREHPRLCARLRQGISPEEGRIALRTLVRREELEPTARVEIFAEIADHLRKTTTVPEEVSTTLSDEQFVRNTVDVVFRGVKERITDNKAVEDE